MSEAPPESFQVTNFWHTIISALNDGVVFFDWLAYISHGPPKKYMLGQACIPSAT